MLEEPRDQRRGGDDGDLYRLRAQVAEMFEDGCLAGLRNRPAYGRREPRPRW